MLDIKYFFTTVAKRKDTNLNGIATKLGLSYSNFLRKIGKDGGKMQIGTMEYILHELGYTFTIGVCDETGRQFLTLNSDPNEPLLDPEKIRAKQQLFTDNLRKNSHDEEGNKKANVGFSLNHPEYREIKNNPVD